MTTPTLQLDMFLLGVCVGAVAALVLAMLVLTARTLWRARKALDEPQEGPRVGFGNELLFQESPADPKPQGGDEGPFRVVPRFGQPVPTIHVPDQYAAPLRCSSGQRCGHRELEAGEMFYAIPSPDDPAGPFLVLCSDDVLLIEAGWD